MENIKVTLQERSNPFEIMAAVEKILVEHGCLSISLIQRKLRIGFTHAYRIIEYLKDAGELYQDGLVYRSHRLTPLAPDAANAARQTGQNLPDTETVKRALSTRTPRR